MSLEEAPKPQQNNPKAETYAEFLDRVELDDTKLSNLAHEMDGQAEEVINEAHQSLAVGEVPPPEVLKREDEIRDQIARVPDNIVEELPPMGGLEAVLLEEPRVPTPPYAKKIVETPGGLKLSEEDKKWQNQVMSLKIEVDAKRAKREDLDKLIQSLPPHLKKWASSGILSSEVPQASGTVGGVTLDKGPVPDLVGEVPLKKNAVQEAAKPTEKLPNQDEMTLDEIEKKQLFAKDTARPLETAYWEQERALAEEKMKAKEKLAKIVYLDEQLKNARENLAANPTDGTIQKTIDGLEQEKGRLAEGSTWGERFKNSVKSVYEKAKEKGRPVWNFLSSTRVWERSFGALTLGWWDFHQAEKLRSGTNKAEDVIRERAGAMTPTDNLRDQKWIAEADAGRMSRILKEAGIENPTKEDYETVSMLVTDRKERENKEAEDQIISASMAKLKDKIENSSKILGYRTARGGQEVLTQENMTALDAELRAELSKLRDGRIRGDLLNYASIMRRNLDPHWKRRYVYGGIEMALGAVGWKLITLQLEKLAIGVNKALLEQGVQSAAGKAGVGSAEAAKGVGAASEQIKVEINKNIWNTLRKISWDNGLKLGDSDLMDLSKKVLDSNNMFEQEWLKPGANIQDLMSSRKIPLHWGLKIPLEVAKRIGMTIYS